MRKVSLRGGLSIYKGFDQSIVLRNSRLVFRTWALIAFFVFCFVCLQTKTAGSRQTVCVSGRAPGRYAQTDR